MTHEIILKMIEAVSPDDTAKLDEIDARVFEFLTRKETKNTWHPSAKKAWIAFQWRWVPKYTRSRDALKAIRPEGWRFEMFFVWPDVGEEYTYKAFNRKLGAKLDVINMVSDVFLECVSETEELAELHAIIQAIAYERSQS